MSAAYTSPNHLSPAVGPLHSIDARAKLIAVAVLAGSATAVASLQGILLLTATLCGLYLATKAPAAAILRQARFLLGIAVLAIVCGSGGDGPVILAVGRLTYTLADAVAGAKVAVHLVLLLAAAGWLPLSTTPADMVQALSRLLAPLRRMHLPVDSFVFAVFIALRLLPTFAMEAQRVRRAQVARAANCATGLVGTWRRGSSLVIPLFAATLRRADVLAETLVVRGYQPGTQLHYEKQPLQIADLGFIGVMAVIACMAALL